MKNFIKRILNIFFKDNFLLLNSSKHGSRIALTFDDGPHEINTKKLLMILKEAAVKGTFFLLGSEVEKYPELVRQVKENGHEIGMHSFSHKKLADIGIKKYKKELEQTSKLLYELSGIHPSLFRPPFGELSLDIINIVLQMRLKFVGWTIDSEDSFNKQKDKLIQLVKTKNIKGQDVILFHEDYDSTIEALPEIIDILKKQGFQMVTVSELKESNG